MTNILSSSLCATIDIIALIFILVFALHGAIKGFTKTFFSLFGTFIGLLLAVLLAPSVVKFMQSKHGLISSFANELDGVVTNLFGKNVLSIKISDANKATLTSAGLGGYIASIILSLKTGSYSPDATVGDALCPTFAYYIVLILSVVVLFILFKLIFAVLCSLVKDAYKNKKVEKFDKTLGFFLGIVHGIIIFELVIMIISIIPLNFFQNIYANIQISTIAKFIADINMFNLIITAISQNNVINIIISTI